MMSTQSSVPESLTRFKNLLLTGPPGCGKTTVLERAMEHLGVFDWRRKSGVGRKSGVEEIRCQFIILEAEEIREIRCRKSGVSSPFSGRNPVSVSMPRRGIQEDENGGGKT